MWKTRSLRSPMFHQYTEFSEKHVSETTPRNMNNPEIRSNGKLFRQEMTQEEIKEQINYEETAGSLHYLEDCSQYTEENQMEPYTDC